MDYGEFPTGKYFNPGGYTLMIWVKVLNNWQIIIGFRNGVPKNNTITYTAQINDAERTLNYIGKSYSSGNTNIHAVFDEMKIFNRELSTVVIAVEKEKTNF